MCGSIVEMMRPLHAALVACAVFAAALNPNAACAGERRVHAIEPRYDGEPQYDPYYYSYNETSVSRSPDLLLPGLFPPWVLDCFQTRDIRTPAGWARQRIWVCS